MKKRIILIFGLFFLRLGSMHPAHAYIDPGTTGSIFSVISGFAPFIVAVVGFLLLPLKRLLKFFRHKKEVEHAEKKSATSGD